MHLTLRTKLVLSVIGLFALVTLATGLATVLALNTFLRDQLDTQVRTTASRVPGALQGRGDFADRRGGDALGSTAGSTPRSTPDSGPGPTTSPARSTGGENPTPELPPGLSGGLVRLEVRDGAVVRTIAVSAGQRIASLSGTQVRTVLDAGLGPQPRTVDLGGALGSYRMMARYEPDGMTVITGLPLGPVTATAHRLTLVVILVGATGLLVTAGASWWLVRRNLRPLRRVTAVARRVAHLPLESGAVALADRVPAQDIDARSEVGQVGAALNGLLDNVSAALTARHESEQRVRQFVADASHELRTPLASIRGYAELCRRTGDRAPSDVVHAMRRVESEAMRMAALVDDLLLLARLDAGRPLAQEEVDLVRLTVDAVGDAHAAGPGHRWRLEVPDGVLTVTGDQARLHQVLANVLSNARTHTPAGTTIGCSVRADGGQVLVQVEDDGPGVPTSLQHNVFDRFARGDGSRSRTGGSTGLGLSIAQAVVTAHRGEISLTSRPGRTRVTIRLPRSARPATSPAHLSDDTGVAQSPS